MNRAADIEVCKVCIRPIRMQIYRGTGVCCGACHDYREQDRRLAAGNTKKRLVT